MNNNDLSEFIDAEIFSSGKFNGSTSHITQSRSKLNKFSHKFDETRAYEVESGSFFSATVKGQEQDVIIRAGRDARKVVDISSSER